MPRTAPQLRHVIIVDTRPDDYAPLLASRTLPDAVFHFATTAEAALAMPRLPNALWLVNQCLPDASGIEVSEAMRARDSQIKLLLISDQPPSAEAELRARAPLLLIKPAQAAWLTAVSHAFQPDAPCVAARYLPT